MHRPSRSTWLVLVAVFVSVAGRAAAAEQSPFADAVAAWRLAGPGDSAGADSRLTVQGKAALGVELAGPEREASLRRGGDGMAADLDGGYLSASGWRTR